MTNMWRNLCLMLPSLRWFDRRKKQGWKVEEVFGFKKIPPKTNMTGWKNSHEWRCISLLKEWFSIVMLVFGCNTEVKINMPYVEAKLAAGKKNSSTNHLFERPPQKNGETYLGTERSQNQRSSSPNMKAGTCWDRFPREVPPSQKTKNSPKKWWNWKHYFPDFLSGMSCCCSQFKLRGCQKSGGSSNFVGHPKKTP